MGVIKDILRTMDYGPSPESSEHVGVWLEEHESGFGHFINGVFTKPGDLFDVFNPANGERIARVSQGSAKDIDAAVAAARKAQAKWAALSGFERSKHIYALARHVQKRERFLSVLETIDNGKPIRESRDIDIPLVARHFYHHAGWASLIDSEFPATEPCGVVGQIIPWNFPLLMLAWKIAPALAAGNTVVLKPAEFTPLTALAFAELCVEAELPAGVVNIVTGDGTTGEALVMHDDVDKIAFTGSTEVGRAIRKATAASHKRLSLELGGKSPFVIFEDADLDSAVEGLVDGIWLNQGQVCCAGSRLLVQESVSEALVDKVRRRMSTLRVGAPLDKAVDVGAIVARVQLERIDRLVKQGVAEGATCWQPDGFSMPAKGLYFPPTLLSNVHPASTVAQQEIFGPVLAAMTFRTPREAVELANNTTYGLAASVWSESVNVALQVATQVKAGVVWVNSTNLFDAACGFGGYRESGYGREGGREGMLEYLEPAWFAKAPALKADKSARTEEKNGAEKAGKSAGHDGTLSIDRTVKLYIGGKQARPDSGYSFEVRGLDGKLLGEAPLGNRKDIRNAVEAARKAADGWARATAHNRAQILYYIAENFSQRSEEIAGRLARVVGAKQARREVAATVERVFSYAAWADKFDGLVHNPPMRNISIAMNEAIGTAGVLCPAEAPLLGFVTTVMPLVAMGNAVIAIPSGRYPLVMGDLYQVFETSDLPGGVINLVSGRPTKLLRVLAEHADVDALWSFGDDAQSVMAKSLSAGNLKQVFTNEGRAIDWFDAAQSEGKWWLRHAVQVKNVWVPYGE